MIFNRLSQAAIVSITCWVACLSPGEAKASGVASDEVIEDLPVEDVRNFSDIFARLKSDYVEEVSDKKLIENAIRGMLSGLDPHSSYLDPEEYSELRISTSGQFGGLGIQVGMEDGYVKVISPIDDTPAFRAGIKAGDVIIRLDDKPIKDMTLNEAVKLMRGEPGTHIELSIMREGRDRPLKFDLERAIISVKSVKSHLLEPGYAYVRISTFQSKTANHLEQAIIDLKAVNRKPLKGMIVDLRNNPGGVLSAAADVADLFIENGKLVYTQGRVVDSRAEFNAMPGDIIKDVPMVVLINGGSASASEIVAGALQDHHRAIIMGEKSFGKGSVQTIQELRNGGAVKFTTARYYTPSGRSIQAEGIEPDIVLKDMNITPEEPAVVDQIKEADLSGHLENLDSQKKTKARPGSDDEMIERLQQDYKIHEALNLLKGIDILSARQKMKQE